MISIENIRKVLFAAFFLGIAHVLCAQGVYFDPAPTDVTSPARLYLDVTSSECSCPELQDVNPEDNPLYIWAWNPNEEREDVNGNSALNGEWGSSNDNLQMTQDPDNPNFWYFDFLGASLVQFYDQPAAIFYNDGIDFLVKEKNGAPPDLPEQKSPDINIVPEPIGCFEKICPFPTTFYQDEYFFITYDNNQEGNPALQNLGPNECLIWFQYKVDDGSLQTLQENTEKFKMRFDGDGIFSKSMIPEDYFELNEGEQLTEIKVFVTTDPINAPPFALTFDPLIPGCE
jgi:hypothetical protein